MTPLRNLIVAGLLLSPAVALAETQTIRCQAAHAVRNSGPAIPDPGGVAPTELRLTVFFFDNADLADPAVIERLTVRNAFGAILHDSGPKIGIPHPLNNVDGPVPPAAKNITTVPPGGTFAISTVHFGTPQWGLNAIPGETPFSAGGLSVTFEVSKPGPRRLFLMHARETTRERIRIGDPTMPGPLTLGVERSSQITRCFPVRDRDEG